MEAALALLAFSAPVTAAIWTRSSRKASASGVTKAEFDQFVTQMNRRFDDLREDLRELRQLVNDTL